MSGIVFSDVHPRGKKQSVYKPTTPPDRYYYIFRSSDGASVRVMRGDGPPTMTGGIGGWNQIARPRRVALTQWGGREPYQMDVPILFNGWHDQQSVEREIRQLNKMGLGLDWHQPPTVTLDGAHPDVAVAGAQWVINDITWGDDVYWDLGKDGTPFRMRQDAVVHLLEYHEEDRLNIVVTKSLPNTYIVHRKGETLRSIAKAMYGNGDRWKDIKKANPKIRDPNKLPLKTKLRIP
jgi:hypothetical protein